MKFRKKPIVVDAEIFHPDGPKIEGVILKTEDSPLFMAANKDGCFEQVGYIETLEGKMMVCKGDYVITGINGEKYPCKPDIFEKTYERVED